MNTARWIFSEIIRLIRACWLIYFEANPFAFREGDSSRSFVEGISLVSGIGGYLAKKINTTGLLYVKRASLLPEMVSSVGSTGFLFRIVCNGVDVYEQNAHPFPGIEVNLILGPGEYTFFCYQNTGGGRIGHFVFEAWERDEDDNSNRLRALSPAKN